MGDLRAVRERLTSVQLGTRWPVEGEPPRGLPAVVLAAVHAVEEELRALDTDATTWRWTLTWFEASPQVELDDGTRIRYNKAEDSATISQSAAESEADDEDSADPEGAAG